VWKSTAGPRLHSGSRGIYVASTATPYDPYFKLVARLRSRCQPWQALLSPNHHQHLRDKELQVEQVQVFVKIYIMASFSNAMNLWEILLVPSLRRAVVPGPYARSRSVSLDLPQSSQT